MNAGIFKILLLIPLVLFCFLPQKVHARDIRLCMPTYSEGLSDFYFELLEKSLQECGHEVHFRLKGDHPQLRERKMLQAGELDLLWLLRTDERDRELIRIPVGLTRGMIGKRVLLVRPENVYRYKDVASIDDFRKFGDVAGMGKDWYDCLIWEKNGLDYLAVSNWRVLHRMAAVGNRGVDYLSRGLNQVVNEAHLYRGLVIEPHLLLEYDRDFYFYLSPKSSHLEPVLREALEKARDSGLLERLIKKYWAENLVVIKPESRKVLHLKD